jgi:spore maturation protein CgeB
MSARGHRVVFLERDVPWYAENRDQAKLRDGVLHFYKSVAELKRKFRTMVRTADVCIVGSYVPDGAEVGEWVCRTAGGVKAFYDIDTPITISKLDSGDHSYLTPAQVPLYDLYLSFSGGPLLRKIERKYRAQMARPLYCSVDPLLYFPEDAEPIWDLGYMGTYSEDRQILLKKLLFEAARDNDNYKMVVAGPLYPKGLDWPANVKHIEHLPPKKHRHFYNSQRFTLNLTRADMVKAGYSPSVRLFEAAACATPIISDYWAGLETFLEPEKEVLIATNDADVKLYLTEISAAKRKQIGERARKRVLKDHTAEHRVRELEGFIDEIQKQGHPLTDEPLLSGAIA